ncbi:MAG TPA: hypothetical protein VIM75_16805 [Ohtaekwangia sp.]|uniref:hypothetical protein n=1 Tax=Ohtaekwangia sp. TaxID=2066019 RepID=UPI002F9217C0
MEKNNQEKFSGNILKDESIKNTFGGRMAADEQYNTNTSKGTTYVTLFGSSDPDCSDDGDSYSSC